MDVLQSRRLNDDPYDVVVVGGGLSGLATAARLEARGLSTVVLEAHATPGGCAGFFRRRGFSFDVGATTLVDFQAGGIGGELLDSIGMASPPWDELPGYVAWLPDRTVTLHRDQALWKAERLRSLGDTPAHRKLWTFLDRLSHTFWRASRRGIRLPIQSFADAWHALKCIGLSSLPSALPSARFLGWTLGDALRKFGLRGDAALVGLLSMLVEDTVHSTVDDAPLPNAALGISIRGAGLARCRGGMRGFFSRLVAHYRSLGGKLLVGSRVERIAGKAGRFMISTRRGDIAARQVVGAIPAACVAGLGPTAVTEALQPHLRRNATQLGGAVIVFLGVPEREVIGQGFTHHQLLHDYAKPVGNGNNMFISVSSPGDLESAPPGLRAVMISTHCELSPWQSFDPEAYEIMKREVGKSLLGLARRIYPELGTSPVVFEVGTPRTYERFTRRPFGAVGGYRLTLNNANQRAIPHDVGVPGFYLAGDTTWPGLGTVACVLSSRIVAEKVLERATALDRDRRSLDVSPRHRKASAWTRPTAIPG